MTVDVTSDGAGLVSHAGSVLLAAVADRLGLTSGLSSRLAAVKQRRRGHDPGRVIRDLAVMLADGGECVPDLLVAACAEKAALTILHYDADFDRIAKLTGQAAQWVVPRGSVA